MNDAAALDDAHLTLAEASRYLKFTETAPTDPEQACLKYLKRAGIPMRHRGRIVLVERRILDAYLDKKAWTKRRTW